MHPFTYFERSNMTQMSSDNAKPKRVTTSLAKLETDPDLFQHRLVKLDNAHVEALTHVIRRGEMFDPLTVWQNEDGKLVVVDGHHRVEAYRRAGWSKKVPVVIHQCTEENAQFLTMSENGKQRLQMTREEKSNWAWTMVTDYPALTASRIADGPVSLRQVRNMRATKKRLEEAGQDLPRTWRMAMMLDKGDASEWDEAAREEVRKARKAKLLEAIRPHLALAAQRDPEIALEVVLEVMGEDRFESACSWAGYRKMSQAEIEGELDNLPF